MNYYEVGQVWERDGKRREIVKIEMAGLHIPPLQSVPIDEPRGWFCYWRRKLGAKARCCWRGNWRVWAEKATLVTPAASKGAE